ncbi:MAG: glycosyltransferase family 2 protein [Candidatus Margulisbacteria bacterium]|nr:glycosyltransferase family 2 protein [Candidatus Margulisiibacteriota bacterium]MBU1022222.1 glycosyltransferase family 2 protein [Candidatus Margulisiibacteriota bacterium]MBU1729339.1 glycosyltransferase family 2 protein [Candidatus Margulisiibacteriota bacterium]MBU1955612.1 glycosyltransferase family 2 protein [Candidatus Margulisiibacteriota bacterium]
MKLSIIIPVYNEQNTLLEILKRVQALDLNKEIIIVDDYSTDRTREILSKYKEANTKIILQSKNQGKGAAIREGIKMAGGDYVIIQDADLEYNPQEILKLIKLVIDGQAQVVYGSRFKGKHVFRSLSHYLGNKLLTLITNLLYRTTLTDMETCYKLIPTDLIKQIPLRANRFDFEPEITAKILKRGYKITEVPISYDSRTFAQGKKISWKDGFAAIYALIKYKFKD